MKKVNLKRKLLFIGLASAGLAGISTSAMVLSSCSSKQATSDSQTKKLNAQYTNEYTAALGNDQGAGFYQVTKSNETAVKAVVDKYLELAIQLKNDVYTGFKSMSFDAKIWLDSFIYTLEVKQQILESNIRYLIADPFSDVLVMTQYRNNVITKSQSLLNLFGYTDNWSTNADAIASNFNYYATWIKNIEQNLKDGVTAGVTFSGVMTKLTLADMLQTLCVKQLDTWCSSLGSGDSINEDKFKTLRSQYFSGNQIYQNWKTNVQIDNTKKTEVETALTNAENVLDQLIQYLTTIYYNEGVKYGKTVKNNTSSGGGVTNYATSNASSEKYSLSIASNPVNEENNSYSFTQTSTGNKLYLQNLGLTEQDLQTKDIGIGFSGPGGQAIYNAMLKQNSNVEDSAEEQYKSGETATKEILESMKNVANYIANLYSTDTDKTWKTTVMYDSDSSGPLPAKSVELEIRKSDGTIDMKSFFQYLNSEQFFNGRDMTDDQYAAIYYNGKIYPIKSRYVANQGKYVGEDITTDNKTPYLYRADFKGQTNNRGAQFQVSGVKIGDIIGEPYGELDGKEQIFEAIIDGSESQETVTFGDAGNLWYKFLVRGYSPATVQNQNPSVRSEIKQQTSSGDANGSASTIKQYDSISPEAGYVGASRAVYQYLVYKQDTASHLTAGFKKTPINYTLRTGTGGAAYASSGAGGVNWVDEAWGGFYLDVNPYFGLQKWSMSTLSNHEGVTGHVYQFNYALTNPPSEDAISFRSTAYAEGWGLFSEWLALQLGVYGEPVSITKTGDGYSATYQNKIGLPAFGKGSKTTDVTKLDSDYANGSYVLNNGNVTEGTKKQNSQELYDALQYFGFLNERQLRAMRIPVDIGIHAGKGGTFTAGQGYSLKEARDFLQENSGLGLDDIKRETKRYLNYVAQATSYYNGLEVMENIFLYAKFTYEQNNPNKVFMDWKNPGSTQRNTQDLFDLILRNGNVPLEVLETYAKIYIANNY